MTTTFISTWQVTCAVVTVAIETFLFLTAELLPDDIPLIR